MPQGVSPLNEFNISASSSLNVKVLNGTVFIRLDKAFNK